MASIQTFWSNTLKNTYKEVKKIRDEKNESLTHDCFVKNQKSQEEYSACIKKFYDEFSKF